MSGRGRLTFSLQMMAGWGLGVWGRLAEGWGVGEGASHLFPPDDGGLGVGGVGEAG